MFSEEFGFYPIFSKIDFLQKSRPCNLRFSAHEALGCIYLKFHTLKVPCQIDFVPIGFSDFFGLTTLAS